MKQRTWERAGEGISLTVLYEDNDITDTPDGLCYTVKMWNMRAVNMIGAGFTSDDNVQIIVMRGDYRVDLLRKVYAKQL